MTVEFLSMAMTRHVINIIERVYGLTVEDDIVVELVDYFKAKLTAFEEEING